MTEYLSQKYNHKERWSSYLEQINLSIDCKSKNILYVGIGSGLVSNYLSKMHEVTTFDSNKKLKPDIHGDILEFGKKVDKRYDLLICCQVLEHIDYNRLEFILKQFKENVNKNVILSLPDSRHHFRAEFRLNKHKYKLKYSVPFTKRYNNIHKWEIGWKGISIDVVRKSIKKHFKIIKEYGLFEDPYYRFYLLEVKK
ncbi:MAG: hypothetical protein V1815_00020 [Candidatus Woesearchaeota archaeon]